jgi:hypothetical protein
MELIGLLAVAFAISGMSWKKEKTEEEIKEQRRYELAKAAMQGLIISGYDKEAGDNLVNRAYNYAQEMVEYPQKQLEEEEAREMGRKDRKHHPQTKTIL